MSCERRLLLSCTAALAIVFLLLPPAAHAQWVTGLAGGSGSTIGPAGDLFVTEGAVGRVSRIDPETGQVTTFASGLPPWLFGAGGAMDVAFLDGTCYVLVTLVGSDIGGNSTVGIYRVDGPSSFTVVADIGAFAMANPPNTPFFIPTGVQYSMETYRGGFLVADGHHNRILRVTRDGDISVLEAFDNIVPTGLEVSGDTVYSSQAGPVPHLPETGKVVSFGPTAEGVTEVASGARLLVDVERGRGTKLYALSQGVWNGVAEGSPAFPFTGSLVEVLADGTLMPIVGGLNQPTSMEFIGNTAYVVMLSGEVWKIEDVSEPPFGR